jgi:hypothetical protein
LRLISTELFSPAPCFASFSINNISKKVKVKNHKIIGKACWWLCTLPFALNCWGQSQHIIDSTQKSYDATRITVEPLIDGQLTDSIWNGLPVGDHFSMLAPRNGDPERKTHKTEFKIAYTDEALFIAAYMYDPLGTSIRKEYTQRDNVPQTDYIVLDLNTYNDGENQTRFVVTTAGGDGRR